MKNIFSILFIFLSFCLLPACGNLHGDQAGPQISDIQTSGNVLVISDCSGTAVTISARVTDPSGVQNVQFWYRTGDGPKFSSANMELEQDLYRITLNGPDFLGRPYGVLAFYITASDKRGNTSKSAINQSVQFLPCVNN
jgi:hypothetical protein